MVITGHEDVNQYLSDKTKCLPPISNKNVSMFDFPLVIVTLSQFHYDPSYRIYTKGPSKQYTFEFEQRVEPPNCRGLFRKEWKALKCQTLGATAHVVVLVRWLESLSLANYTLLFVWIETHDHSIHMSSAVLQAQQLYTAGIPLLEAYLLPMANNRTHNERLSQKQNGR